MRAASAATLHRGGDAVLRSWIALREQALRLEAARPAAVLAPLIVLQWVLVLLLARAAEHNGWLWYSGGDATEYWTHEWALAHRMLPYALLGWGVPFAFSWVTAITGDNPFASLPPIVLVQTLVLLPLATVCVYGIASRLAGRLFAAFATLVWVVTPLAIVPLWRSDYHDRYVSVFLPQLYGLVNMGDFPSLVVLTALAYVVFRVVDAGRGNDAVAAGLLLGLAIGVKPSNALVAVAPPAALVLARRWRSLVALLVALAPTLLVLALWKQRGLGSVPLFALTEVREAASVGAIPVVDRVPHYLQFSWDQFHVNMADLREFFWSRLLWYFVVVAGGFALLRKSLPKGVYVLLWFAAFYVVKGGSSQASLAAGSYLRLTLPGAPALMLLVAAVALLVPTWGRRRSAPRVPETMPRPTWRLGAAGVLVVLVPLVVIAVSRPSTADALVRIPGATGGPVSDVLRVGARPTADGVRLTWRTVAGAGVHPFYLVFRAPAGQSTCTTESPRYCTLRMEYAGRTAIGAFEDTPRPGRYVYRVALAASFRPDNADYGDVMLLSPPLEARAGRGA